MFSGFGVLSCLFGFWVPVLGFLGLVWFSFVAWVLGVVCFCRGFEVVCEFGFVACCFWVCFSMSFGLFRL